jgi:hypothetical protein
MRLRRSSLAAFLLFFGASHLGAQPVWNNYKLQYC